MATPADYLVGPVIGQGSFGTVLFGRHKHTDEPVAIKVFDKYSLQKHPAQLQSVLNEQRLLRQLESDHIVRLLSSFHDAQCAYMVLECCTRGDLAVVMEQYRRRQPTAIETIVGYYGLRIAQAIDFLHSRHIVHADIKPENILVTANHQVRLTDLGCALAEGATANTSTATPPGTAAYAAPEVLSCEKITTAIDIWSYGCTIYALWVGCSPFMKETEALTVDCVLAHSQGKGSPEFPSQLPPDWRPFLQVLLHPCSDERPRCLETVWRETLGMEKGAPPPLDVEPAWLTESRTCELRDGSLGWGAYLM